MDEKLKQANAALAAENEALRRLNDELSARLKAQQATNAGLQIALAETDDAVLCALSEESVKACFSGYVVRSKTKPMLFFNKEESAKKSALILARSSSPVEVFALVRVGKAVQGSQWVDAK